MRSEENVCEEGLASDQFFLTLFLLWRGGGQIDFPFSFFLHNSKSIGLKLLKFCDFSVFLNTLRSL